MYIEDRIFFFLFLFPPGETKWTVINLGVRAQEKAIILKTQHQQETHVWHRRPSRGIKIKSYIQTGHDSCSNIQEQLFYWYQKEPESDRPAPQLTKHDPKLIDDWDACWLCHLRGTLWYIWDGWSVLQGASKISEDGLSSAVHTVPIRMAWDHTGAAGEGNQNSPA